MVCISNKTTKLCFRQRYFCQQKKYKENWGVGTTWAEDGKELPWEKRQLFPAPNFCFLHP